MKRSVPAFALALSLASLTAPAAPHAYVASDGNDARGRCTLAAPCRTFQAGHDAVDAGGQVIALDTADYGPVTVSKSVSFVGGAGATAGINVAAGNGMTISNAGIDVVVRNVSITGTGGSSGIVMGAGRSLTVEDCVVAGFSGDGIRVQAASAVSILNTVTRANGGHGAYVVASRVNVASSRFMANGGSGLSMEGAGAIAVNAAVSDSLASGNADRGFSARAVTNGTTVAVSRSTAANNGGAGFANELVGSTGPIARMSVGSSLSSRNGVGFFNTVAGLISFSQLISMGNNQVVLNSVDIDGIITAGAPL